MLVEMTILVGIFLPSEGPGVATQRTVFEAHAQS